MQTPPLAPGSTQHLRHWRPPPLRLMQPPPCRWFAPPERTARHCQRQQQVAQTGTPFCPPHRRKEILMANKEKMRRVLVHVDDKCIRLGQKNRGRRGYPRSENCPVTRALRAANISVQSTAFDIVYFQNGKDTLSLACLPIRAQRALLRFDLCKPQGPLKFNVTVPERFVARKARKGNSNDIPRR